MAHQGTVVGLFAGLTLGVAAAFGGFWIFLLVFAMGLVGLTIGRIVDGDLDLTQYLGGRRRDRSER